jgi:putative oxidoreductase
MKITTIVIRSLLGLMFLATGIMIFLPIKMPPPPAGLAGDFMKALFTSHYIHAVKCFEIAGGLMLLIGRGPLGLLLLGPVIVNILFYDIFLDATALPVGIVVAVLSLFLLWRYRANFAPLLKAG